MPSGLRLNRGITMSIWTYSKLLDYLEKMDWSILNYNCTIEIGQDKFIGVCLFNIQDSSNVMVDGDGNELALTYRTILAVLESDPPLDLTHKVCVKTLDGEWYRIGGASWQRGDDVFHDGHPYFIAM